MANEDKPRGLIPVQHISGSDWDGRYSIYYLPATDGTAVFIGDAVSLAGGADASGKYPSVTQATAGTGNALLGVVVGFGTQPQLMAMLPDLSKRYRLASEEMYVAVVDDPDVLFEIQEDSDGGAIAVTDVMDNAPLIVGSGDTTTGMSGMEIDSSGVVATTEQLRLMRLVNREDNALGNQAKWLVRINEHQLRDAVL